MAKIRAMQSESGNLAEVAEFLLAEQSFGINGSKIKEIIPYEADKVTVPPYHHPAVKGVYLFRGKSVPLIQLNEYLNIRRDEELERQVVVVTEFNEMSTAFVADRVNRIHRLSWASMKPFNTYLAEKAPQIIGSVTVDEREILVLDLEQIIGEIFPSSVVNYDEKSFEDVPQLEERSQARIIFAEDSFIIRTQLIKVFKQLGYTQVDAYGNGQDALDAIVEVSKTAEAASEPLSKHLNLVLSDIEMPRMDGLLLCQTVKLDMKLDVPVVMFSSLINEQVANKCKQAGADAWVSKPQTEQLIATLDRLCFPE
jgi:two-component system chemotaxis response regulator CheV